MGEQMEQVGGVDVAVDAITVGVRHRKDLGDLDKLMESIEKLGLLQPITITPGRVLVCGWRRLEAVKRLGMTQVRAWVRSGLSDDATRLLAERDENALRQAYTRLEQATLYKELKEALKEEAQRRQEASRFRSAADGDLDDSNIVGAVDSTAPHDLGGSGDVRDQAAMMVTGSKSWQAMERIGKLMDLAVDPSQPEEVQNLAAEAVERIEDGGQVAPEWNQVQALIRSLGGVAEGEADDGDSDAPSEQPPVQERPQRISLYALRRWAMAWEGIARLLDEHDPVLLGSALPPKDWATLCDVHSRLTDFVEQVREARSQHADSAGTGESGGGDPAEDGRTLATVIPLGARS